MFTWICEPLRGENLNLLKGLKELVVFAYSIYGRRIERTPRRRRHGPFEGLKVEQNKWKLVLRADQSRAGNKTKQQDRPQG